jgi:hypothetical protein
VGSNSNEWVATDVALRATANSDLSTTHYPFFIHTILACLVPPFSPFFLAVLEHYQVQALHLHPDTVTLLAAFAFACEAYVGVEPSVVLLHHLFHLHLTVPDQNSGCVSFRAVDGLSFLGMNWAERTQGFRHGWVFVNAHVAILYFKIPVVAATKSSSWAAEKLEDAVIAPVMTRLAELAQAGLTGTTVVREFLSWRIAPVQEHRRKMWAFTGFKDINAAQLLRAG